MNLSYRDSQPFWVRLILDPIRALDLVDQNGLPDHTKVIPFLTIVAIFALKALSMPITVWEMVVLCTASFGGASWNRFLRSRMLSGTVDLSTVTQVSEAKTVIHNILERRDPVEGIDPTNA